MVQITQNYELFDQKKWFTIFHKALTPFWKTILQLKQIFDENYHLSMFHKLLLSKHVQQCKTCTNMADPISLKDSERCLNSHLAL